MRTSKYFVLKIYKTLIIIALLLLMEYLKNQFKILNNNQSGSCAAYF